MKAAIASIDDDAWTAIEYPQAIWEEAEQRWVSDAEVAEVPFAAFTGRKKSERVDCRLIVRRVKRHQQLASDGTEQGELFATHRHQAFIANSTLSMIEADERHRDHAIIEQTIAELKEGPLAHLGEVHRQRRVGRLCGAHVQPLFRRSTRCPQIVGREDARCVWLPFMQGVHFP